MEKYTYKAHGKVILIGEHSVVYGYDALAMPIEALNISTTVEKFNQNWMDTDRYHGPLIAAPAEYNGIKYVVDTLLAKSQSTQPVKLSYQGKIPVERGLGSSATVALGTSMALNQFLDLKLDHDQIMAITNHAEMINHGKASGLDAATVSSDQLIFFNKKSGPQKIAGKLGASLLIMDTGELGNTREAVSMVKAKYDASDVVKKQMKRLGDLATATKEAWLEKATEKIGQYFNEAQEILTDFALSTPRIDQLKQIALDNKALGFKLSGGGLGGIVITLCYNQADAQQIADLSQKYINDYWIEEI